MSDELYESVKLSEDELRQELHELQASFDLTWRADRRGIRLWQESTGQRHVWPDHGKLICWLLQRLQSAEATILGIREAGSITIDRTTLNESDSALLTVMLYCEHYKRSHPDAFQLLDGYEVEPEFGTDEEE